VVPFSTQGQRFKVKVKRLEKGDFRFSFGL
jgi:hypothetical protein